MARRRRRKRHQEAKRKKQRKSQRARAGGSVDGMLTVTYPNGRKERIPDDGKHNLPAGTMITYDALNSRGQPEMRWCVTGGGWPFDD